MDSDTVDEKAAANAAADFIMDTLRQLLTVLGALLATPAGQVAAKDAGLSRSLPALSKALKKLWFDSASFGSWDSKEQAVWFSRVSAISEGTRSGLLSFYGAGVLLCDALLAFAVFAVGDGQAEVIDSAWAAGALSVQEALQGRSSDRLQQLQADRRCGGGKDAMISCNKLPAVVRRTLDLEGKELSTMQTVGLGTVMMMPGGMTVTFGGVGAVMLVRKLKQGKSKEGEDKWEKLQEQCLERAHQRFRQKNFPIEVRYASATGGPSRLKVCAFASEDRLGLVPAGGPWGSGVAFVGREGAGKESSQCCLRPKGKSDTWRLRVFRPGFVDVALMDGVLARRGDRLVVMPSADERSGEMRCVTEDEFEFEAAKSRLLQRGPAPIVEADIKTWVIVSTVGHRVRKAKDTSSDVLGAKAHGEHVRGILDGEWVALASEPGYMLLRLPSGIACLCNIEDAAEAPRANADGEEPGHADVGAASEHLRSSETPPTEVLVEDLRPMPPHCDDIVKEGSEWSTASTSEGSEPDSALTPEFPTTTVPGPSAPQGADDASEPSNFVRGGAEASAPGCAVHSFAELPPDPTVPLSPPAVGLPCEEAPFGIERGELEPIVEADIQTWVIETAVGHRVRKAKDTSSDVLGAKANGEQVRGILDGEWVALTSEPGFMLLRLPNGFAFLRNIEVAAEAPRVKAGSEKPGLSLIHI